MSSRVRRACLLLALVIVASQLLLGSHAVQHLAVAPGQCVLCLYQAGHGLEAIQPAAFDAAVFEVDRPLPIVWVAAPAFFHPRRFLHERAPPRPPVI